MSFDLRQALQTSSVKSQIVNILGFAGHIMIAIASAFSSSFLQPLTNVKAILSLYAIQKHSPQAIVPTPGLRGCSVDIRSNQSRVLLGRLLGKRKAEERIRNWFSPLWPGL